MNHGSRARQLSSVAWCRASKSLALCALLILIGCAGPAIEGPPIRVAGASTPQSQLFGQLALVMLQEHGYPVLDRTDLRSELAVRKALAAGSVDVCWAYTGDTWSVGLDHDIPISSADLLYQRVRDEDRLNGITWLSPAPHGRSLGILMAPDRARQLEITTLSDLAHHIRNRDSGLSIVTPQEFYSESTGLLGLERVYDFEFRHEHVHLSNSPERYDRVSTGEIDCLLGHAYESELLGHDLLLLEDDLGFFVYSHLAVGVRSSTLDDYDDLESLLLNLSASLDDQTMIELGRQIIVEEKDPTRVAAKYLRQQNLIGPTPKPAGD